MNSACRDADLPKESIIKIRYPKCRKNINDDTNIRITNPETNSLLSICGDSHWPWPCPPSVGQVRSPVMHAIGATPEMTKKETNFKMTVKAFQMGMTHAIPLLPCASSRCALWSPLPHVLLLARRGDLLLGAPGTTPGALRSTGA